MQRFKLRSFITALALLAICSVSFAQSVNLEEQKWIHGSADCSVNTDDPIQIVQYNSNTWILRQNKCTHFEAPFMYLFLGKEKALLTDTGATKEQEKFPLYKTVRRLIDNWDKEHNTSMELVVLHTHNHGDHKAADAQFNGKARTTVVGLQPEEVASFFYINNWPDENVTVDLGGRKLDIIPIPGHQESSVAVYDRNTQIMLTGDTFYPGRLYVADWASFRSSISKLVAFAADNPIKYILGNHIEMSVNDGKDYPMGSKYHPQEQKLPLYLTDLKELHEALNKIGDTPKRDIHDKFIIFPVR
ncbi:MAG: MBL fold metallo-hydrolase [Roseivirga sp.]|nr:MBL fold metallo-hydrolase [Roseivirga sp.]